MNIEDVREGDIISVEYLGATLTGEAYLDSDGDLFIGDNIITSLRDALHGVDIDTLTLVERPEPPKVLPTKPGSIIKNVQIRYLEDLGLYTLAMLGIDGFWRVPSFFSTNVMQAYEPEAIMEWEEV